MWLSYVVFVVAPLDIKPGVLPFLLLAIHMSTVYLTCPARFVSHCNSGMAVGGV